jgi:hypothetical protein
MSEVVENLDNEKIRARAWTGESSKVDEAPKTKEQELRETVHKRLDEMSVGAVTTMHSTAGFPNEWNLFVLEWLADKEKGEQPAKAAINDNPQSISADLSGDWKRIANT